MGEDEDGMSDMSGMGGGGGMTQADFVEIFSQMHGGSGFGFGGGGRRGHSHGFTF